MSELEDLWKSQPVAEGPDPQAVRKDAEGFAKKIWRRNLLEWAAAALVFFFFARSAIREGELLVRIGSGVTALAAVYIAWHLYRFGRLKPAADLDTQSYAWAHLESLRSQARLLRRAPLWYVGPLAVGMGLTMLGRMPVEGGDWLVWGLSTGFVALFCAFVAAINLRGGRKLAAEAEAFEASLEPDSGG